MIHTLVHTAHRGGSDSRSRTRGLIAAVVLIAGIACSREERVESNRTPAFQRAPVIIISIDTLRADRLPPYGYEAVRTPNIDALRSDGILFRSAWSHVPLTLPSHVTLLTGTLPAKNGVRDNIGYRVPPQSTSLPQLLRKSGYATGAAISAYVLRGDTGMRGMFDAYDDAIEFAPDAELGALQRSGTSTAAVAQSWIDSQGTEPFFFLLHLFEPHTPYDAPEPYRSSAPNPYDAEVAQTDAIVGSFLSHLKSSGLYDRAIVILLSDHGEGLGDHGEAEHGIFLYREAIQVPLIVKLPKNHSAGVAIDAPVGLTDVLPTVLSLTGVAIPGGLDGVPLLGPAAAPLGNRKIFSETLYPRLHLGWSDLRSLVDGQHHYIDAPRSELYSLAEDPQQKNNIAADERRTAAAFRSALDAYPRNIAAPSAAIPEEAAKLKALGYISSSAEPDGGPLPDPKERIQDYQQYLAGYESLEAGDATAAIAALQPLLTTNPRFTDAGLALARAYELNEEFDRAADTYRELLTRNPALGEQVALGAGTALLNAGQLDDARRHAELALSWNRGGAHLLLGRIALAAGDLRTAQREAAEASKQTAYEAHALLLDAQVRLSASPSSAPAVLRDLDALRQRRKGEPFAGLEAARANALMYMNRPDDAIPAFRAEIAAYPRNRDAYGRLAAVYLMKGDARAADAVLREMSAAIPTRATIGFAAEVLEQFGQPAAARAWRERLR